MSAAGALRGLAACALCAGGLALGQHGYLGAKAGLAHLLIARAFAATLADGRPRPPWPWADTAPIARLEVPRLRVRRHVLAGASGTSLAFGVGHVDGTAAPNEPGVCLLAGHRDTDFRFLRHLGIGDVIRVLTPRGSVSYRVAGRELVDAASGWVAPVPGDRRRLLALSSCWPLDGVTRGRWRVVFVAVEQYEGHDAGEECDDRSARRKADGGPPQVARRAGRAVRPPPGGAARPAARRGAVALPGLAASAGAARRPRARACPAAGRSAAAGGASRRDGDLRRRARAPRGACGQPRRAARRTGRAR